MVLYNLLVISSLLSIPTSASSQGKTQACLEDWDSFSLKNSEGRPIITCCKFHSEVLIDCLYSRAPTSASRTMLVFLNDLNSEYSKWQTCSQLPVKYRSSGWAPSLPHCKCRNAVNVSPLAYFLHSNCRWLWNSKCSWKQWLIWTCVLRALMNKSGETGGCLSNSVLNQI